MQHDRESVLPALEGMKTKADKIRALALAGYMRTEIAEMIGIRYQHVRQVLERSGISLGRTREVTIAIEPVVEEIIVDEEELRPTAAAYLLDSGFRLIGEWHAPDPENIALTSPAPKDRGVYSFVLDGVIVYVGLTLTGLHTRMGSYRRGYQRQRTSFRVKNLIIAALAAGQRVEVLIATPEPTEWNGLPVNTAAGLEAGLIRKILPAWNMLGATGK